VRIQLKFRRAGGAAVFSATPRHRANAPPLPGTISPTLEISPEYKEKYDVKQVSTRLLFAPGGHRGDKPISGYIYQFLFQTLKWIIFHIAQNTSGDGYNPRHLLVVVSQPAI
jgi:hypothetical protein